MIVIQRAVQLPPTTSLGAGNLAIGTVMILPVEQIASMYADSSVSTNAVIVPNYGALPYAVPCGTTASAFSYIQQIQNFINSDCNRVFTPVIYVGGAPTFASVNPSAYPVGAQEFAMTVTGTNFLLSGINLFQLVSGLNVVAELTPVVIASDTEIDAGMHSFLVAGVYQVQYSTDNGGSWVNAGALTITAS